MTLTQKDLDAWFTYHPPNSGQLMRYQSIRQAAKDFAATIVHNTPSCADQTAAIRKIREAVMTANAAIACEQAANEE